jgi:hypothetical protein
VADSATPPGQLIGQIDAAEVVVLAVPFSAVSGLDGGVTAALAGPAMR